MYFGGWMPKFRRNVITAFRVDDLNMAEALSSVNLVHIYQGIRHHNIFMGQNYLHFVHPRAEGSCKFYKDSVVSFDFGFIFSISVEGSLYCFRQFNQDNFGLYQCDINFLR
jgi:hypothetical protein